tara:strand:- start:2528 stop:2734 length:207 start_codon:yes stop_codon:yes gene_type:complete
MKQANNIELGALVEADVIGTPGTFRTIEGHRAPEAGKVWIRETGLHLRAGVEAFVIEWPIVELREVSR